MAQTEYRRQIDQMFGKVVSLPWESLRGGLVLGGEGLWNKARPLVADSDGDEEIRWHRRASAEEASRLIHSLLEQETDRRVAIWLRVRLGGERMTKVSVAYGYRDGRPPFFADRCNPTSAGKCNRELARRSYLDIGRSLSSVDFADNRALGPMGIRLRRCLIAPRLEER